MPTNVAYPLINGHRYSWASIELGVAGDLTRGFKSINYSDGLEPGKVPGTDPSAIGRTRGKHTAEGSVEMYRTEAQNLIEKIGDGFYEVAWDITVCYREPGLPIITDSIRGVRLKKTNADNSDGSDASSLKFDPDIILPILWNGIAGVIAR